MTTTPHKADCTYRRPPANLSSLDPSCPRCRELDAICDRAMTDVMGQVEKDTCPYCGQMFYAPVGRDPLKHHVDCCEARPYTEGDDE